MTLTQTVDIPESRRFMVEAPREIPTGPAIIVFIPKSMEQKEKRTPGSIMEQSCKDFNIPRMRDLKPDPTKIPVPGCHKGKIWMADDFDAPLEDFKDYM